MAAADPVLIDAIAKALGPIDAVRVAYLFGSRARGTARPDSDLDLAVAYPRDADSAQRECARRAIVAAVTDVFGALGEHTDVVDLEYAPSEIGFAAIHGVRVLARTEEERVHIEVRVARRYDDESPRRELFRAAAKRVAEEMARRSDGRS